MTDSTRLPMQVDRVLDALVELQRQAIALEHHFAERLAVVPESQRASAANLVHYLSVRQHDIRRLQHELHVRGLSSLGRMEAYVLATLRAVSSALARLEGRPPPALDATTSAASSFAEGRERLSRHTKALFGPTPPERFVRIMCTMPSDAADNDAVVRELLGAGMNVMRINCAKDDPETWRRMIANLRRAEQQLERRCLVQMDLAGPNPRTQLDHKFRVRVGDRLTLTPPGATPSQAARRDEADNAIIEPAVAGCTLPEALRDARVGERFFYDDGGVGGIVREVAEGRITIEITRVVKGSAKLKNDKSINFPDTKLDLPALTGRDLDDLDFVVREADVVGMSFVRTVGDVEALIDALRQRDAHRLGLVLKIETQQAFEALPDLLLAGMRHPPLGVMVARGDMGVEIGFNRMSEVQEEILWLCEAAHVPVIWATQVLENLAKEGLPTRAEVTDAAMSGRAECVMLNKGEFMVETVKFLGEVVARMASHQHKKRATLRKLAVSEVDS